MCSLQNADTQWLCGTYLLYNAIISDFRLMHSHAQLSLTALMLDGASKEFKGNSARRGGNEQTG